MSKTITELWYGNISPITQFGKNDTQRKELLGLLEKNYQRLKKALNKKQWKIFESYYECTNEYLGLSEEKAFCEGFSLSAKILTEALTNAEEIIQNIN